MLIDIPVVVEEEAADISTVEIVIFSYKIGQIVFIISLLYEIQEIL